MKKSQWVCGIDLLQNNFIKGLKMRLNPNTSLFDDRGIIKQLIIVNRYLIGLQLRYFLKIKLMFLYLLC
jgi:hypothetical protein